MDTLVGKTGHLTIATGGKYGTVGEVLLRCGGGTETFLARSDVPLQKNQEVLCVEAQPGRTLFVVPWGEPLVSTPE